jgi:hypothetical protein
MIVLYKGSRGKGKTLTLVKDLLKYHLDGYKIYSNIQLTFGEFIPSSEVLLLSRDSNLRNCVLGIDEIELFFDSRNFSKLENKTFSNFLQQLRKRNIIILCTAQFTNLIDIRLRNQLDFMCYPSFDKHTGYCSACYFDLTKMENSLSNAPISSGLVVYDAKPIFKLYNTLELL